MRGLWLHLLRGGGRSARLEIGLPLAAGCLITLVLLLLLGLQQGLDHRADRTAWRTPDQAEGAATAVQAGYIDYVDDRPITVIELAALTDERPEVPGTGDFPEPGEVWVSPELARLLDRLPDDRLAERFPAPATAELGREVLESPDELLAIIGRSPDDPAMTGERPEHQWHRASSLTPTRIDGWSTSPDLYQTTYRDIALLVTVLTALPLVGLGGLASRLTAARRRRRTATLRLLGASTAQVARLTAAELTAFAGLGAVLGVILHRLLLPLASHASIKGGTWFIDDVRPGLWPTLAVAAAVVAVLNLGALTGLVPAVRDPLGTYRRSGQDAARLRWWSALFIAGAIALFWARSSNPFVTVAFTAVLILGWGLVAVSPWILGGLGRVLAATARNPVALLAGRRLADDPRGAWRAVGGMALAAYIGGFVAAGLPIGLGAAGAYAERSDRLDAVVAAESVEDAVDEATAVLAAADIPAEVTATAPPNWLDAGEWAELTVAVSGSDADLDRARTALTANGLWGPELQLSDDQPNAWLLKDGIAIGLLVMPIAALVGLTSMIIGTIARILSQRETLTGLHLAGTPRRVLVAAQRRETILPTALLGGIAATAGLASGSTLGSANLLNPYTFGILTGLVALGALALALADRTARPVLERVGTDLSERE